LIELVTEKNPIPPNLFHAKAPSRFILSIVVTESAVRSGFPQTTSGGPFSGGSHWDAGKQLVGTTIRVDISAPQKPTFLNLSANIDHLVAACGVSGTVPLAAGHAQAKLFFAVQLL
jgi:hypothetical protein